MHTGTDMNIDALRLAAASFKQALQSEDREGLVRSAKVLIDGSAPLGPQWPNAAQQLMRWGELTLAMRAYDLWASQMGVQASARHEKAVALARVGQSAQARQIIAEIPEDQPSIVANAYLRGAIALNLGDTAEAEKQLRRAVTALPESARSWLGLAQIGKVTQAEQHFLERLGASGNLRDRTDRAALEAALALFAHARKDYEAAFTHYTRSTQINREGARYSPRDNRESAAVSQLWSAAERERLADDAADATRQPIFVTGLPRSGTTLVEQIISAHSAVDGGGELGLAVQLEARADGFAPQDIDAYLARGGTLADLRALYTRLAGERISGTGYFVDKTLNQSRSLGPMTMLFPDAPVVWLQRDPLDNAFSIYRAWLANSVVSGWTLTDIADHMKIEAAMLSHWQDELGERLLVVPYAELVQQPQEWIERITRHCGLDPEAGQQEFHRNAGAVTTASAMQVREPINTRGLGVADPYRPFMGEFEKAYFTA